MLISCSVKQFLRRGKNNTIRHGLLIEGYKRDKEGAEVAIMSYIAVVVGP